MIRPSQLRLQVSPAQARFQGDRDATSAFLSTPPNRALLALYCGGFRLGAPRNYSATPCLSGRFGPEKSVASPSQPTRELVSFHPEAG